MLPTEHPPLPLTRRFVAISVIALTLFSYSVGLAVSTSFFTAEIIHRDMLVEAVGGGFLVAVLPLIWWMTRRFDSRRARGPLQLWAVLAGLFAAIFAYGHYAESYIDAQRPSSRLIMPTHDVSDGINQETAGQIRGQFSGLAAALDPGTKGIERKLAEELFQITEIVTREALLHQQRLQEVGFPSILVPGRLAIDKTQGMTESFQILESVDDLSNRQITKGRQFLAESRSRLEGIFPTPGERRVAMEQFDRSAKHTEAIWHLERLILAEYKTLVELLATESEWAVIEGRILFEQEAPLNRFNNHLLSIQRMSERQTEELRKAATSLDSLLGDAKQRLR